VLLSLSGAFVWMTRSGVPSADAAEA
jgi:hypothetical protein